MINVNDLFLDVLDKINEPSNGQLTYARFNRYLWLAQLRTLDWLSGDVSGIIPPTPYLAEKNRAWLSEFTIQYPVQVSGGQVVKPDDYYVWDNAYILGDYNKTPDCETQDEPEEGCNMPIELLSSDEFYYRCNTLVEGLEPSLKKPIAKEITNKDRINTFQFLPSDLGSIVIEYIRYPVKAYISTVNDPVYNEPIYDAATSVDLEWSPFAQDILAWFVADQYFNYISNQAGKTFNNITGKTVREAK